MTTPGGVPNLPVGALTVDTLAYKLHDMSTAAMRGRAAERMPSIFDTSTGGNALSDLTPFGILTQLWAGFNSAVARADPADIQGPDDLPELLLKFIEELPVIGQLVELMEAIFGTYDGDDQVLLAIQEVFRPIRQLLQLVAGQDVGIPSPEDIVAGWTDLLSELGAIVNTLSTAIFGTYDGDDQVLLAIQEVFRPIRALVQLVAGMDVEMPDVGMPTLEELTAGWGTIGARADAIGSDVTHIAKNIFDGWFGGSSATGTPAEVATTMAAIQQAVINGYTVDTFTSSGTWTKPANVVEITAIVIGGGRTGAAGTNGVSGSDAPGGAGGVGGGFRAQNIDPATLGPTVAVTVASAGGDSSFGGLTSVADAGGLATAFGYAATSSTPGKGGTGGLGRNSGAGLAGTAGTASAAGAGGVGGGVGQTGSPGSSVPAAATTKCGGGGGGGGGGNVSGTNTAGWAGGPGGYPGGGGGGGGGGAFYVVLGSGAGGAGGIGGAGCVWVFWR